MNGKSLFAIFCLPLAAAAADGQDLLDMPLEQLLDVEMVSASKYSQRRSEIPAATTVIGADQIKGFGYRTLGEVLASVPGMHISSDRMYDTLGVRGLSGNSDQNGRVLVMIDGMRVNDALYDQGPVSSEFPLDVDLIERVEVVRGPASSVYGSNAFLATVNIISKSGRNLDGAQMAGSYGGFDTYKGRASFGRKHQNGLEYLVSATGLNSEGPDLYYPEFDDPQHNNGQADNRNNQHTKQFFAKAAYGGFSFLGGWARRDLGLPDGRYGSNFNDPRANYQDTYGFLQGQYQATIIPKLDFTARAWYGDYGFRGRFPFDEGDGDPSLYRAEADWSGFELRLLSTQFERHHLVGGIEVQKNWSQTMDSRDSDTVYFTIGKSSHRVGVYLQDDIALTDRLNLLLGARFDDHSLVRESMFSPKVGLTWQALDDTTFKLLYGKSFRAINFYHQYEAYPPSLDTDGNLLVPGEKANPGLLPERGETLQGSWEQRFDHAWLARTTLYYVWLDDIISRKLVDPYYYQTVNAQSQAGWGGEFELERRWANGALLRASYSQQYAQYRTGQILIDAPQHLFKVNLMAPLFDPDWHGGVEVLGVGPRRSDYGDIPGYVLANATLNWKVHPHVELSASIYNILDRDFISPANFDGIPNRVGVPSDGRDFRLKMEFSF